MLHLSLAGNTLRAVGGTPKLYDPNIIPSYPMLMPGRIPDLVLHLRKMTKENLQTFIDVCSYTAKDFSLCANVANHRWRRLWRREPNQNRTNITP